VLPVASSVSMLPNKRMQLAGASILRNVGLREAEQSPQLMRGPLGSHDHLCTLRSAGTRDGFSGDLAGT
jgi:hypothetical protein